MSLSPEEKKLDKLNKLFELVNEEYATPDDLIQLSEAILSILKAERENEDKKMAEYHSEMSADMQKSRAEIDSRMSSLQNLIAALRNDAASDRKEDAQALSQATESLSKEIKRVERKIPTKTDLSGLERDIADIKDSFNSFPTELTVNGEAVRDGLELLVGDERLDKSAIKGLDDYEEIAALARTKGGQKSFGVHLLRYLSDVNIEGITNGQTILWNSTTNRFEPGSGGSGGGHTIEDEGTPLTQRTNLNFTGTGVTVTDAGGKTVVNIPGGGGSGMTRTVTNISGNTTAGSTALTEYVYNCTGALTLTLPTAVGNTNRYTVTRISGLTTVATTGGQTINGSATATLTINQMSLDLVSDGANWNVV